MKETHNQDCPLCFGFAEFQFVDYENRKGALKNQVQRFLERMLHGKKVQAVES